MDPQDMENDGERDQATASTSQQPTLSPVIIHQAVPSLAQRSPTSVTRTARSAERLQAEDDTYSPRLHPLPPLPGGSEPRTPGRARTLDTTRSGPPVSRLDWIVPLEEKARPVIPKLSVGERLQPTVARAHLEHDKYAIKAKMTGYALNAAIGLQVLLGSLTTGLAAATASGRQAAVATTILGGLSTIVASYLARARGSNEPELSITRVKDLEQFIRESEAFQMDHGHVMTNEYDETLFRLRSRFEELLGNGSGERKLAPPV